MKDGVFIVTGLVSGIGYHIAREHSQKGYMVIAVDIIKSAFDEENIEFY